MLVGGADVRLKVQAVGFVELAREAVSREQAHGFHTATYRGFKIRVRENTSESSLHIILIAFSNLRKGKIIFIHYII